MRIFITVVSLLQFLKIIRDRRDLPGDHEGGRAGRTTARTRQSDIRAARGR